MSSVRNINHLGIIPDGSRRWARRQGRSYYDAYVLAMEKLCDFIEIGFSRGIHIISIYGLSKENLSRTPSDLEAVFNAEVYFFSDLLPPICDRWQCKTIHAGEKEGLPNFFYDALSGICQHTSNYDVRKLYLLVNYNPWDEIKSAIDCSLDPHHFEQNLWIKEKIDLVIRTAYVSLLSNFAPLQSGYAELYFSDNLFNDMNDDEFISIIDNFPNAKERLFGR